MRTPSWKFVAASLLLVLPITCAAQQTPPLSRQTAAVKQKADQLFPSAPISVVRQGADEEFGTFVSNDQESFTFYDIDRKAQITLQYVAVKKIKWLTVL